MSSLKDMAGSGAFGLMPAMAVGKADSDTPIAPFGIAPALTLNALKKKKPDAPAGTDKSADLTDTTGPFG